MSPSISAAPRTIGVGVSSVTSTDWELATGVSFKGVTVIETIAGAESVVPSFTVNVKLSLPVKFAFGV